MNINTIKSYKSVHTWTGIISGLLLYIGFVAGGMTLFKGPLNQWALQTDLNLPAIELAQYDTLIQQVLAEHPQSAKKLKINLPEAFPQSAPVTWVIEDPQTHAVSQWHASLDEQGELMVRQQSLSAVGEFIDVLHRTAGIPGGQGHDAIGTYILGIAAGLYFVALVSGVIIFLPTWFKDLWSFRRGPNRKRYWLDFHNILGISSLPFHLIIALTAFVFAFHDQLYGLLGALVYQGEPMFTRQQPGDPFQFNQLLSVADITNAIKTLEPGFQIREINFNRLDSAAPNALVGGVTYGELARGAEYSYVVINPYSGNIPFTSMLPSHLNDYSQWVLSLFALHFGNYGGQWVRWIYFLLSVAGALIFVTGNLLWIESRRKKQKRNASTPKQAKNTEVMARLTVGVCLGILLGISGACLTAKWLPHDQYNISFWQQFAYYVGFLASIAWSFWRSPTNAALDLIAVNCIGYLALLLVSVTGLFTPGFAQVNITVALMSLVVLICLLVTLVRLKQRQKVQSGDSVWAT